MVKAREPQSPPVAAESTVSRAERPLKLLIAASVIFPIVIYVIAGWISYGQHVSEATDRLQRTVAAMQEHASKVFETFAISERYLEELFNDTPDATIRGNEAEYSKRIRNFIATLPQLRDLWVIDGNGKPLVAGTVNPLPRDLDLSDRAYFQAHRNPDVDTYISEVIEARAAATEFFAITRKRLTADGRFDGVYLVSIAPEYFSNYYASLPRSDLTVAGLVRNDGVALARFPANSEFKRSAPGSIFMRAIAASPESGVTDGSSSVDSQRRIGAYSKLPGHDVYVYAALDVSRIRAKWLHAMAAHLIFGIPATLMMAGLGMFALRQARREAIVNAQLRQEAARRQSTELALRQAQKMDAVGRLTGGIAHDFNNLLTAIIGNIELALRRNTSTDARVANSLNAIRQASMRAATLVQRLLTFSRQHPQEVKAVNVNRLVNEMSEILHRAIGETVRVETVLASGLWNTALDPNQLESAILNLAVNARDAMPDGGRLTIETSNAYLDETYVRQSGAEVEAGQFVLVAVSDTGTGMSLDVRDRAFDPFFTTKPAGAGSGLGLSMVYGFVKQSHGHIQIYSEIGQGTSIKMYFPRLSDPSAFPAWEDSAEPIAPGSGEHSEAILLVEDDADVSRFVVDALSDIGYRVTHAATAAEALEKIKTMPDIALLFTDVILPGGMNGRELANAVKRTHPNLPVLFATGYTRNAIIHHGRLDSDVDLLTKPFTTEALAKKLREMLDGEKPPEKA
ncbi:hybrid sensor histidine kinase/response regulator [Undibacter mobilis]|uniref:histidine kinase n=1 Tax=Undibacter mobilis TaxID=2292256 RepID=A0A371B310_9BRAD|nr:hybrid sensor histidine kinase/response regulator [Undibacter mobilis]RDV01958.1 response regulator [Undibacter mobilis]